jgi:hypothetical protein
VKRSLLVLTLCLLPVPVAGQVVFDATSESHTASTPSTNQASFSWSHGGAASGVKGVLVFTFDINTTNDNVTGVTYGGSALSAVASGSARDTASEPGGAKAWFLGSSVPQGTQTVEVTRTNNADGVYAIAITVTAGGDTETTGTVTVNENATPSEQSINDGSPGTNSTRFAGLYFGNSTATAGANSTLLHEIDLASQGCLVVRETTAGQGARSVGFTAAGADDLASVYLAIRQVAGGGGATGLRVGLPMTGVGK